MVTHDALFLVICLTLGVEVMNGQPFSKESRNVISDCPCSNPKWCEPIKDTTRKEVFVFSLTNDESHWLQYDWSKITTVVMVGYLNHSLMCLAHSYNVRAVIVGSLKKDDMSNEESRQMWILLQLTKVVTNFLDGINFDFEDVIMENDTETRQNYTALVKETNQVFKSKSRYLQVSVDTAWKPNTDVRFYDYPALAEASDFLFIMAYDEQSQIFGECVAGPNSGLRATAYGLDVYLSDPAYNISVNKLVLGVPWYGYIYPCVHLDKDKCFLKETPFRGVNCSDAAGKEYDYSYIVKLLNTLPDAFRWNSSSSTPYISYKDQGQNVSYQVQFDDPTSLSLKYQLALQLKLRGVGMWNIDSLDYSDTETGNQIRKQMFGVLPDYKNL